MSSSSETAYAMESLQEQRCGTDSPPDTERQENVSPSPTDSLPPTDRGKDAYLTLMCCTMAQLPIWGIHPLRHHTSRLTDPRLLRLFRHLSRILQPTRKSHQHSLIRNNRHHRSTTARCNVSHDAVCFPRSHAVSAPASPLRAAWSCSDGR